MRLKRFSKNIINAMNKLYYIHDPMCSWCWAFRPVWMAIKSHMADAYPDCSIEYVLGGLAPDSNQLMDAATQRYVIENWQRIQEHVPGTVFNYRFWSDCQPRRSTYPSCRAVLAAKTQAVEFEEPMILAIQEAYYLNAQNPSDTSTLNACAKRVGADVSVWEQYFSSAECEVQLQQNVSTYKRLAVKTGVSGFPSVVLLSDERLFAIPVDYNNSGVSIRQIEAIFDE